MIGILGLVLAWGTLAGARATLRVPSGLQARYFTSDRLDAEPSLARVVRNLSTSQLARDWSSVPPERFRARWYGYLMVNTPDTYTFATSSDDGSSLTIDGRLVVDNGGVHEMAERTGQIRLEPGAHFVVVDYFQNGGLYGIEWRWAGSNDGLARVPAWRLSTARAPYWALLSARALDVTGRGVLVALVGWLLVALATVGRRPTTRTLERWPRAACLALFVGLAVVHTWPMARDPASLSRNDNADTILNEWILSWVVHQAVHEPSRLFQANIFYPERDTLAYSEPVIIQSALAAPVRWLGGSPVLAYNLVLIGGFALTGWAMTLVVQQWTGSWVAGLMSGLLFGFNAHTLTRLPHIQAQHVYFLPLAMLALDAFLRRPDLRRAWQLAIWFVLQALTSIHLLVFTAVALTVGALVRPADWFGPRVVRVAAWALVAAGIASVLLLPFLLPYWRVQQEQGLTRTFTDALMYSASWMDYTTTPSRFHRAMWGDWLPVSGTGLFPGAIGLALAAVAVLTGIAWRDPRARMCLAAGVVGVVLSFGAHLPGYEAAQRWLPLLQSIRAPVRFGYLGIFGVSVVAGFGMMALRRRLAPRAGLVLAAVLLPLAALEPLAAPLYLVRAEPIPRIYERLRGERHAVVLEVPFYSARSAFLNARYMLASTAHWQPQLAGYSGFVPLSYRRHAERFLAFPDAGAIDALKGVGVTHVFVHLGAYPPALMHNLEQLPVLSLVAVEDGIALYAVK